MREKACGAFRDIAARARERKKMSASVRIIRDFGTRDVSAGRDL